MRNPTLTDNDFDLDNSVSLDNNDFDLGNSTSIDNENIEDRIKKIFYSGNPVMGDPDAFLNYIAPKNEDTPELIGSTAFGIAANAKKINPVAEAVYSTVGSASGEAYKQLAQHFGLMEGAPPETSEEALKEIWAAGKRGAAGSLIGTGIGKGVKKVVPYIAEPFKKAYDSTIEIQRKIAEKYGIKAAIENLSKSKFVQALGRTAEFSPFGLGVEATEIKEKALKQLENFAEKILKNIGDKTTPEIISESVINKFKFFEKAFSDVKDKLYIAAYKKMKKNVVPVILETQNAILTAIETLKGSPEITPPLLKKLEDLYKRYNSGGIKNFNQLRIDARNIGNMIGTAFNDPAIGGNKSVLEMIYAAMQKDLDATAGQISPAFASALKNADDVFSKGLNYMKRSIYKTIEKTAKEKPSKLFSVVFNPENPDSLTVANKIFGKEELKQMRIQWMEDIINDSTTNIEGVLQLSPVELAGKISKYRKILPQMFANAPEQLKAVNDLMDIGLLLSRGRKVTSGSPTGYIEGMFDALQGLLTSKLVTSDFGRKLLTTGFPIAQGLAKNLKPSAQLISQNLMQKVSKKDNKSGR